MSVSIRSGRFVKAWFIRLRLHILVAPFSSVLKKLLFLSDLSQWIRRQDELPFHDLDNPQFDYSKRYELYDYVVHSQGLDGPIDYLEFGVGLGHSFEWWVGHNKHAASRFFGFDTFDGLPENWGPHQQGAFSAKGAVPQISDSRASFKKGLFQDTLAEFLIDYKSTARKVVHMDADLYSATFFALATIFPIIKANDILLFDEFGVPLHEFKAFREFTAAFPFEYEILGAVNSYMQLAMRVK